MEKCTNIDYMQDFEISREDSERTPTEERMLALLKNKDFTTIWDHIVFSAHEGRSDMHGKLRCLVNLMTPEGTEPLDLVDLLLYAALRRKANLLVEGIMTSSQYIEEGLEHEDYVYSIEKTRQTIQRRENRMNVSFESALFDGDQDPKHFANALGYGLIGIFKGREPLIHALFTQVLEGLASNEAELKQSIESIKSYRAPGGVSVGSEDIRGRVENTGALED